MQQSPMARLSGERAAAWQGLALLLARLMLGGAAMLPAAVAASGSPDRIGGCPATPNCVSSRSDAGTHHVRPFGFDGSADAAWLRLKQALQVEPGLVIVAEEPPDHYLHAEATSRIFRFVDDVEFRVVPEAGIVEVRSASRDGYWDFGVNRRRVERLRERFGQLAQRR